MCLWWQVIHQLVYRASTKEISMDQSTIRIPINWSYVFMVGYSHEKKSNFHESNSISIHAFVLIICMLAMYAFCLYFARLK